MPHPATQENVAGLLPAARGDEDDAMNLSERRRPPDKTTTAEPQAADLIEELRHVALEKLFRIAYREYVSRRLQDEFFELRNAVGDWAEVAANVAARARM